MTAKECCDYVMQHVEVRYATNSGPYLSNKKITPVGCVNHSLGVAQPSVDKVFESMNDSSARWGVHAILGDFDKGEGRILLTLPWNIRPWGCGSGSKGSYNNDRIQWEICEPAGHTYNGGTMIGYNVEKNEEYFNRMWKMLVAWNVYCAIKYDYSVNKICCHSEAYTQGYASNHADVMHWFPKHGKNMDILRAEISKVLNGSTEPSKLQAKDLKGMTETDVVMKVGPLFTENQNETGILASVSLAQFILESGYASTDLAQNANNCFGMKTVLSGNTWKGSTWDGKSKYTKLTKEFYDGKEVTVSADFRKYPNIEDSIADHSAYLLNAKNGDDLRYAGLKKCKKPKKAIKIIKEGGYATDPQYVSKLMNIIKRFNLTQYDSTSTVETEKETFESNKIVTYRVRVASGCLRIRTGPGTDYSWNGLYTGPGVFTIVKTQDGEGSDSGWGLLLSYKQQENGWIALDYASKV